MLSYPHYPRIRNGSLQLKKGNSELCTNRLTTLAFGPLVDVSSYAPNPPFTPEVAR